MSTRAPHTVHEVTSRREQWVRDCMGHLMRASGITPERARNEAEAWLGDTLNNDITESARTAADDIMSYWTAD